MSWLDRFHGAVGERTVAPAGRSAEPAAVQHTTVQIRGPSRNAPLGEIADVWFTFADGTVTLTDWDGTAIAEPIAVPAEADPRAVARRAARKRRGDNSRFNRRLNHLPSGEI